MGEQGNIEHSSSRLAPHLSLPSAQLSSVDLHAHFFALPDCQSAAFLDYMQ